MYKEKEKGKSEGLDCFPILQPLREDDRKLVTNDSLME